MKSQKFSVLLFFLSKLLTAIKSIACFDERCPKTSSCTPGKKWKSKFRMLVAFVSLNFIWFTLLGFKIGSQTREYDLLGLVSNLFGHWSVVAVLNLFNIVSSDEMQACFPSSK